MFSQTYYVVRSQGTGQYLVARPAQDNADGFLLLFSSDYDALSYLNTHAPGNQGMGKVEGIPSTSIRSTLDRWQLCGVGIVEDPLIPQIQFFRIETGLPFR
jgi:hypothetical protein